jgi:Universal stress protein family
MTTILCAVLRPESEHAAALAGALARRLRLPLTLVDIRPTRPDLLARDAAPDASAPDTMPPPPSDLDTLAEQTGLPRVRCERMEAPPAAAIEAISAQPDVELVVTSYAGAGPLAALRDVRAPLVVVPEPVRQDPLLGDPPAIACTLGDDHPTPAAAGLAFDLAGRLDAILAFVDAGGDVAALHGTASRAGSGATDGPADGLQVLAGEDAHALHPWSGAHRADLLVTGPPRHGPLMSALRDPVVHVAVCDGGVPVVVVPEPVV